MMCIVHGELARVTVTVADYGDGEVVDVERKSDLGGNICVKGMMILSACLYRIFKDEALILMRILYLNNPIKKLTVIVHRLLNTAL